MTIKHNPTTNDYLNFDLLITRAGEGYRAYVVDAPGGDASVAFDLPAAALARGRLVHGVGTRRGVRLISDPATPPPPSLREQGGLLYETIFCEGVRSVLIASQSEAQAAGRDLRIRLRFSEDAVQLATLPWEILFDAEQQHFLALSTARPILRYLSLPRPRPALVVQPPLSILAVLASPTDHHALNIDQEWQAIEAALADLRANDKIRLERLATPTFDALRARLLGEPVHVLHFIGHGLYNVGEGEGQLLFEDSRGKGDLVPAKALALLLHNHPSLRLAYLNACEGAIADHGNVFAGVAQTLVQQGVPAAVAMQDEISDDAAIEMARTFYTALATGRPVDAALSHARVALATRDNDEWAIPVLFSRSPDNRLFDVVEVLPTPTCPYPGMRPFTTEQADKFFGREREIADAVNRLAQHPFLTVIGPSGSGKSSLAYAGLIPALRKAGRFGDGDWTVKLMRPSDSRTADGKAAPMQALSQLLDLAPQSRITNLHSPTLLFIDQFEELFTLADAGEAAHFLKALHTLMQTPNLYLLLTVRADFYPELMAMGPLWEAVKANRLELTPLGDDELWAAIVQPAAAVGVTVDEALVVELIHDAAGEAGVLPLVQETLVLLWEKVASRQLKLKAYQAMADGGRSGIQVAIDRRASVVYNNLPAAAQPIAHRIFLRLIQFGEGRADTRRQQTVAELRAGGDDPASFAETLRTLTDSRLLTTSGEEGDPNRRVDISHEALIGGWALLQTWIGEKRVAESTRRRLEEKATDWLNTDKRSGLLNAFDLQEAKRWQAGADAAELGVSTVLAELIAESGAALQAQERAKRNQRLFAGAAVLAIVLLIIGALFNNNRNQQAQIAIQETAAAEQATAAAVIAAGAAQAAKDAGELATRATAVATAVIGAQQEAKAAQTAEAKAEGEARIAAAQARRAMAENLAGQSQLLTRADDRPGDPALILARDAALTDLTVSTDRALRFALSAARWQQTLPAAAQRHQGAVNSIAFSPNGEWIASGGNDGTVRIWRAIDLEPSRRFFGHTGSVQSVRFSPDSERIVSSGEDGSVRLWDVATGEQVAQLDGHTGYVWSVRFSPDGERIVSSGEDGSVRVWDVATTEQMAQLDGHSGNVYSVSFSADGERIVSGGEDGSARVWNAATQDQVAQYDGHEENAQQFGWDGDVLSVAFDSDGERIISSGRNGDVQVWDVATGEQVAQLDTTGSVWSVGFSPDGERIVAGSSHFPDSGGRVRIWDTSGTELAVWVTAHQGGVISVEFSPDGARIVSGSSNGSIEVWDVAAGNQVAWLDGPDDAVYSVEISPDGERIASGGEDGSVRVWDVATGEQVAQLEGHQGDVLSVDISPNGERIVSGGEDASIRVWDVATGEQVAQFEGHPLSVLSVAFSPNSEHIVSGGQEGTVRIWDGVTGERVALLDPHDSSVQSVEFSPDGKRIVSGNYTGRVRVWDVDTEEQIAQFDGHDTSVWSVGFSPDGERIVSGGGDGTVRIWDVTTGEQVAQLDGRQGDVWSVDFSPDGKRIVSGGSDGSVKLWDVATGEQMFQLDGHEGRVWSVRFRTSKNLQTADRIISGGQDGTVRVWGVDESERVDQLDGHHEDVFSVGFSPDGDNIVSSAGADPVRLWDVSAGRQITQVRIHGGKINPVEFSPDGERIVIGNHNLGIQIWDLAAGRLIRWDTGYLPATTSVGFSPGGERIVSGAWDGSLRIWDAATGEQVVQFEGHQGEVLSVNFSPDGKRIISGGEDGTIQIWDATTGEQVVQLDGHEGSVESVEFSPDGNPQTANRIVSGGEDGTVRVWDAMTGEQVVQFEGHDGTVYSVRFSPDGERIASGGEDSSVRLWDLTVGEQVVQLDDHDGSVYSVGFSPDGKRIVSAGADGAVRIWDGPERVRLKVIARISRPAPVLTAAERWQFGIESDAAFPDQRILGPLMAQAELLRLVERGQELALEGNISAATVHLEEALILSPTLGIDPAVRARELGIPVLVREAESLARQGQTDEAVARFEQVVAYEPSLGIDPVVRAADLAPALIAYGETVKGTIMPYLDQYWLFDGEAGDVIIVQAAEDESSLVTSLSLYGPDGEVLAENNDFSIYYSDERGWKMSDSIVLPDTGMYRIRVGGSADTQGDYVLELRLAEETP